MVVFLDDMLIHSRTPEDHTHYLRTALEGPQKNELYAKLKKCEFWLEKVPFWGHVVSKEGISMDSQNIEVIT